jgi:hypothetical protein
LRLPDKSYDPYWPHEFYLPCPSCLHYQLPKSTNLVVPHYIIFCIPLSWVKTFSSETHAFLLQVSSQWLPGQVASKHVLQVELHLYPLYSDTAAQETDG